MIKTLPRFFFVPISFVVALYFMFNDLRGDVIVHFVDIGGIVDHICLNFIFMIMSNKYNKGLNGIIKKFLGYNL